MEQAQQLKETDHDKGIKSLDRMFKSIPAHDGEVHIVPPRTYTDLKSFVTNADRKNPSSPGFELHNVLTKGGARAISQGGGTPDLKGIEAAVFEMSTAYKSRFLLIEYVVDKADVASMVDAVKSGLAEASPLLFPSKPLLDVTIKGTNVKTTNIGTETQTLKVSDIFYDHLGTLFIEVSLVTKKDLSVVPKKK
ncbi:MAG: hypothetical protein Q7S22_08455 [Candidatus Micrarchaeota archaeon]|nr:hypothetical protein [Candidatus Micrarchaeota archaeon]